jgi:hypothetical protein
MKHVLDIQCFVVNNHPDDGTSVSKHVGAGTYDLFYCILISAFCWFQIRNSLHSFSSQAEFSRMFKFHYNQQPLNSYNTTLNIRMHDYMRALTQQHSSTTFFSLLLALPQWKNSVLQKYFIFFNCAPETV